MIRVIVLVFAQAPQYVAAVQGSSCARTSCDRPQGSLAGSPQEARRSLCWASVSWEASPTGLTADASQMGGSHLGKCVVCGLEPA